MAFAQRGSSCRPHSTDRELEIVCHRVDHLHAAHDDVQFEVVSRIEILLDQLRVRMGNAVRRSLVLQEQGDITNVSLGKFDLGVFPRGSEVQDLAKVISEFSEGKDEQLALAGGGLGKAPGTGGPAALCQKRLEMLRFTG